MLGLEDKSIEAAYQAIKENWTYFPCDEDEWKVCLTKAIQAYEAAKGDGWRPISELEEGELVYVEGVSKCCGCEGDELCALAYRDKDGDIVTQSQDILDWHDMKFYPLPTSPKSEV